MEILKIEPVRHLVSGHRRLVVEEDHRASSLKSAQRTCSTCSSAVAVVEALVVEEVQVCLFLFTVILSMLTWNTVFTASFGNGGFRTTRMGGQGFRAAPQQQRNGEPVSGFLQFLPILLLFGFTLLSALPSLFTTPPIPDPRASFSPSARYNLQKETAHHGIKYYINPNEFMNHPSIGPELVKQGIDLKTYTDQVVFKGGPVLTQFEKNLEQLYKQDLYSLCQMGIEKKERDKQGLIGVFGIGTDWEKVRALQKQPVKECEEGKQRGFWR